MIQSYRCAWTLLSLKERSGHGKLYWNRFIFGACFLLLLVTDNGGFAFLTVVMALTVGYFCVGL